MSRSLLGSRAWRRRALVAALAAVGGGGAACSIPNTAFHATPDADGPGGAALAIVTSAHTLDVDEGKTSDFTVALSQAPAQPVIVKIVGADSAAASKLGLSIAQLRFDAANFAQPQPITVTGLVDPDAADAVANLNVSADGLDPTTVAVTIHDPDVVAIATDIATSGTLTVNETGMAMVHVHLTHQPAGDVRVKALLGSGPVTVTPPERVFTAANYDQDQVFTFAAPDDVNTISETESLTFSATGVADKLYSILDVDKDTLNLSVSPSTTAVPEGGSKLVSISLTKQPAANTTVHVAVQKGNVSLDRADLTFTPQNYDQVQTVNVSAPQDANTVNETDQLTVSIPALPTVTAVTVGVSTVDDDVQAILEDAPNPLTVAEDGSATFGVTLKFQPAANVTVSISSNDLNVATVSPGTLTFTPANYADPLVHKVTVTGTHDANLATNTTGVLLHEPTLVDVTAPVSVTDVDKQAIQLSVATLNVDEGKTGTFTVRLAYDPGTTTTLAVATTNSTSLPVDKTALTFTGGAAGTWATPQTVTVAPPIDSNNLSETATITVSGGGAPPATIAATAVDATVVKAYGYPTPFGGAASIALGQMIAIKITTDATTTLDSFGVYIPSGSGDFRMAVYADGVNAPGSLVAQMPVRQAISGQTNIGNITDVALPIGTYWIAFRAAQTTAVGLNTAITGPTCVAVLNLSNLDTAWPTAFGSANCQQAGLLNFFINTYHQ